jgi:DNA-binding PadR family transcriptional regulator
VTPPRPPALPEASGPPERSRDDLRVGDWAVLGLVAEGPTHGFALAALLAGDGELGRIWTMPRPAVYQAMAKLTGRSLLQADGTERSPLGPTRTIFEVTGPGRDRLAAWVARPVVHVRDLRSSFLVKLALLARSGQDRGPLLDAQRAELVTGLAALDSERAASAGLDRMVMTWRRSSHQAAIAFIDELAGDLDGARSG